jgi:hypothetical protein
MYIHARVDKPVLLNMWLFFSSFMALMWANSIYIYSLYYYTGSAEKAPDFGLCVYLLCPGLAFALLCGGSIRKPGDLSATLMVLMSLPLGMSLRYKA